MATKPRKANARRSKKAGLPPGTLVYVGDRKADTVRITYMDYDSERFQERQVLSVEDCYRYKESPTTTWINVDGLHEVDIIERLGNAYSVHPLALEDIVHTAQRPKLEDFEKSVFVVLRMLTFDDQNSSIDSEQVSLVLGRNFVMSFQERVGDVFDQVRNRIRNGKGRIRGAGADYLLYALVDAVVDNYFLVLEKLGEKIEAVEEELLSQATENTLQEIHKLKREMISLRKSVWPLRELIGGLQRNESGLIGKSTNLYLRDVYDHTIQVIDAIESYRDIVSGMLDIYLSALSNKMNAVMKTLTIIATLFIPLTFVAGIYGMNFKYMPETRWRFGYPMSLLLMLAIAAGLLAYCRKKKWL